MVQKLTWAELKQAGARAVHKGDCTNTIVAPGPDGEDNYHLCMGRANHAPGDVQEHYCGCSYVWKTTGEIVGRPEWGQA